MTGRDAIGTVGFFNDRGGYGFIETEDSDEDMFFHMEGIGSPDLTDGTRAQFDIEQADKGPNATNVVREDLESRSYSRSANRNFPTPAVLTTLTRQTIRSFSSLTALKTRTRTTAPIRPSSPAVARIIKSLPPN